MKSVTKKEKRMQVYKKLEGRCGYCGKEIKYKEMQLDHISPKAYKTLNMVLFEGVITDKTDDIENLMPSCRRCNYYKRASTLEQFRQIMETLHKRIEDKYINKVGIDYGIITLIPFKGLFYFETINSPSLLTPNPIKP